MTISKVLALLLCGSTLSTWSTADAADVRVAEIGSGSLVFVDGEIVDGDLQRIEALVSGSGGSTILLRSPGGDALEGMAIGRFLHSIRASTGVAPGFLCASACAMIWVSGTQRYLSPSSLIGFHGAYSEAAHGKKEASSWGNALVGAYLSELGFDSTAIVYMTAAGPDELLWVNREMANALGMGVIEIPNDGASVPAAAQPVAPAREEVPLRLPRGFRWIVLESKPSAEEINVGTWELRLGVPITVVTTKNGYSAAALGPFERADAENLMSRMQEAGMAPEDAYLSSGNGFLLRVH